jgi:hypothetical protein
LLSNPQLLLIVGTVAIVAGSWLLPSAWTRRFLASGPMRRIKRLAAHRAGALMLAGAIALGGDALVSLSHRPVPVAPDEFSYLLTADTFAHGRLTNPTPPMWQHFETPEELLRPTYQSKYPPAQGLFLAMGRRLSGSALAGVWLGSALFAIAICWMLRAYVPAEWALYGAVLASFRFAFFGEWAQSYWGGMLAAAGAALLYGAVGRLKKPASAGSPSALEAGGPAAPEITPTALAAGAVGALLLANTRPFEGLLVALPAAFLVARSFVQWLRCRLRMLPKVLPAVLILAAGIAFMLRYNQRVTGYPFRLAYQEYQRQYDPVPNFVFQHLHPMPEFHDSVMEAFATGSLWEWEWQRSHALATVANKLFEFWQTAFGLALGLPLVLLIFVERHRPWLRWLQAGCFAAIEGMAIHGITFWPAPRTAFMLVLSVALLIQAGILVRLFAKAPGPMYLVAMGAVAVGLLLETWRFQSHYMAPAVPPAILLVVLALYRSATAPRTSFEGALEQTGAMRPCVKPLAFAVLLPIFAAAVAVAPMLLPPSPLERWARRRAEVAQDLAARPGRQLVFVRYGPEHDAFEEWVHNRADLAAARVVWARELDGSGDCALLNAFPGRATWLLIADRNRLTPYSPVCRNVPAPKKPATLELLPVPGG